MMETMIFGVGAAGNKAVIELLKEGIVSEERVKLLNTTSKDIPDEYKVNKNIMTLFPSGLGGCGKEPSKGKKAIINAIQTKNIDFGKIIAPETKQAIVVTSTEGGTGCGATPIIAKFFEAMNIPIHVFAFIGFEDEARGINNTLKFFKELGNDNIILHTIRNSHFKDYSASYRKAEESANKEFAKQVEILLGHKLVPGEQNIDDTDHYKISTTSGYMDIKHISLKGVKNTAMVDDLIIEAFDNGSCLDYEQGCKRLAVIVNASEKVQDAIDEEFKVVKRYIGEPFETYRHMQNVGGEEYIDIIISGLPYPEKAIVEMNNKYNSLKEKVNKDSKPISDIFVNMNLDEDDDDDFNMDVRSIAAPVEANNKFNQFLNNVVVK